MGHAACVVGHVVGTRAFYIARLRPLMNGQVHREPWCDLHRQSRAGDGYRTRVLSLGTPTGLFAELVECENALVKL